jgi:hypothetical protein
MSVNELDLISASMMLCCGAVGLAEIAEDILGLVRGILGLVLGLVRGVSGLLHPSAQFRSQFNVPDVAASL